MADQAKIVADPISSDGSEDSWILLDEMDEAMNEIDGVLKEPSVEEAPETTIPEISIEAAEVATEVATKTYQPLRIEEIQDNDGVNDMEFESKIETISSDLIDTGLSDDNSDSENFSQPYDMVSHTPTTDDGSTTDGSISMISDTEFHIYETKPKRTTTTDGKNRLDMLMNCRPIDMTVKNPRPTVQIRGRCAMPMSIEEMAMQKPAIGEVVINFLENVNNFFATTYLGQVFLLFIAILSLTSYTILYYRYTNMKLAFEELDKKYFDLEVKSMDTERKLTKCEFQYDWELKNKKNEPNEPNEPKSIVTDENQKISANNIGTDYYDLKDQFKYEGPVDEQEDIQPTKLGIEAKERIDKTETISRFDDRFEEEFERDSLIPSTQDNFGRMVWAGEDEPEEPFDDEALPYFDHSVFAHNIDIIAAKVIRFFKERKDDRDIDIESTIEYKPTESATIEYKATESATVEYKPTESGIFCDNIDCNSDAAQKYVQDAPNHHTATKQHKDDETKTKWEKPIDKYHSSEEFDEFEESKEKAKRERTQRKQNIKENNNKDNRKESKGKKDKHHKENHDSGKWNKAERKRIISHGYEHHYDD